MKLTIGQKLYRHDGNYRHYENDDGTRSAGPIFIKSFRTYYVVGETKRSYLITYNENPSTYQLLRATKLPKMDELQWHGYLETWKQVEDAAWVNDNAYRIARRVPGHMSKDQLQRIEAIIDETEGEDT